MFDNTEERKQETESEVTGSTSITTGSETGVVTPLYNSTYGVQFGNASTTTSVQRTPNSITVNRKHSVRYYESEPDTDGYFDIDVVMSSLHHDSHNLNVIGGGILNTKSCWWGEQQCGLFDSDREDFKHWYK